ncbi:MAG: LysO family transporter [Candidatus Atribacteria bacterium]|nr:LysO family transporter [Candidatus Atribacteria bacterium]
MVLIVIALFLGFLLGTIKYVPRKIVNLRNALINGGVLLLVFGMGINIGANSQITRNLKAIGFRALVLALLSSLGGMLGAFLMERYFQKAMKEESQK